MTTKKADYIWFNGEMVRWEDAKVHVMSHALHYGTSVFEGIRCYDSHKGPVVFRHREHMQRLHDSAKIYRFPVSQSIDELMEACRDVIRKNNLTSAYIRPLIFVGDVGMGVNPPAGYSTDVIPSTLRTGVISAAVPDINTSSARYRDSRDRTCSRTSIPSSFASLMMASRVIPGSAEEVNGGVNSTPSFTSNRFSPANNLTSAYIRPLIFVGDVGMGVNPPAGYSTDVIIAAFPWGAYLGAEALEQGIDAMVSSWNRAAPNTIPTAAKAGGNSPYYDHEWWWRNGT